MKRTLLTLLCSATLWMAGAVCFAQTDSASTGTPVLQDSPSGTQQGSAQPPSASDVPSSTSDEAAGNAAHSGMLPATPSQSPLMTVIGALSLAAFTFLLVARRRGVDNS